MGLACTIPAGVDSAEQVRTTAWHCHVSDLLCHLRHLPTKGPSERREGCALRSQWLMTRAAVTITMKYMK